MCRSIIFWLIHLCQDLKQHTKRLRVVIDWYLGHDDPFLDFRLLQLLFTTVLTFRPGHIIWWHFFRVSDIFWGLLRLTRLASHLQPIRGRAEAGAGPITGGIHGLWVGEAKSKRHLGYIFSYISYIHSSRLSIRGCKGLWMPLVSIQYVNQKYDDSPSSIYPAPSLVRAWASVGQRRITAWQPQAALAPSQAAAACLCPIIASDWLPLTNKRPVTRPAPPPLAGECLLRSEAASVENWQATRTVTSSNFSQF